jgi:hypothetical protein
MLPEAVASGAETRNLGFGTLQADASFSTDLEALVAAVPEEYNVPAAADLAMEKLGSLLDNAPPFDNIRGGKWRGQS